MLAATGPISDLPPRPTASENSPPMVVVGGDEDWHHAAARGIDSGVQRAHAASRRSLAASMSTMAEFTAMPVSAMTPWGGQRQRIARDDEASTTPGEGQRHGDGMISGCQ